MPGPRRAEAFAALYRLEFPRLVRTLTVITRDLELAKEIAQEAFIKTYSKWSMVSSFERADLWVRKVAVRQAIRTVSRERRMEPLAEKHDRALADRTSDIDLMNAIGGLPQRQAAAIALFYLEDRPVSEIADIFGTSEATVNVHLHRARKALATKLREEVVRGSR
jgi:RNA polymerase sigma-70 factor (ECF subfamily)